MDEVVHSDWSWCARAVNSIEANEVVVWIVTDFILTIVILCADTLYLLANRAIARLQTMQIDSTKPFPFEALPQELRDMVYKDLLEDVNYPSPIASQLASPLNGMFAGFWGSSKNLRNAQRTPKLNNWIIFANKRIHTEYMDVLCKQGTFRLTVSPGNYLPTTNDNRIWNIAPSTFKQIRKASLQVVTTSAMLGCTDPRNMESSAWELAARIRSELSQLESCTQLTLNAKAIGDPLWNPLWIWYHSSQSFKNIGTSLSDHPTGPTLDKITFSLDTWSPGENFLERDGKGNGAWTWYCMEGHSVGLDGGADQTVREFCGMLYRECRTCRPAEEDEEDD